MSSNDDPFEPNPTGLPIVSGSQSLALSAEAKMESARRNLVVKDFLGELWALYEGDAK